jgi:hypothetical protein
VLKKILYAKMLNYALFIQKKRIKKGISEQSTERQLPPKSQPAKANAGGSMRQCKRSLK